MKWTQLVHANGSLPVASDSKGHPCASDFSRTSRFTMLFCASSAACFIWMQPTFVPAWLAAVRAALHRSRDFVVVTVRRQAAAR